MLHVCEFFIVYPFQDRSDIGCFKLSFLNKIIDFFTATWPIHKIILTSLVVAVLTPIVSCSCTFAFLTLTELSHSSWSKDGLVMLRSGGVCIQILRLRENSICCLRWSKWLSCGRPAINGKERDLWTSVRFGLEEGEGLLWDWRVIGRIWTIRVHTG